MLNNFQKQAPIMSAKEAAFYLRISERTFRKIVAEGLIVPCRVSSRRQVFLEEELDRYLRESMNRAA